MRAPTMCAWRAMRADTRMQKERTLPPPVMPAGLAHSPRLREPATAVYVSKIERACCRERGFQSVSMSAVRGIGDENQMQKWTHANPHEVHTSQPTSPPL